MGTVAKALSLLNYFTADRPEIGLSELTRLSGMNKATVYRMMTELQESRFVEQTDGAKSYRLGTAVLRLSSLREAAVPLRETSKRAVRELATKTGETAHFSILDGAQLATMNYAYSSDHGTCVMMDDAMELPLHATSSGLAVLAFCDPALVDQVLTKKLDVRTPFTVVDPTRLRGMIQNTRDAGIAEYVSGFESDVHSFAAPIFNDARVAIAAIAVAAPVNRVSSENAPVFQRAVFDAAHALTHATGGFPPVGYDLKLEKALV